MAKILIIDDDRQLCQMIARHVEHMGHEATRVFSLKEGLKEVTSGTFDVVLLDVRLPDGNGLDLLPKIRGMAFSPEVIIMTGAGDPDGAELAVKTGAWDYIEKTSSIKQMTLPLARALQYREEKRAGTHPVALKIDGIIGSSHKMKACFDLLAQAAATETNVLITGETGTGKELFAKAIYENSTRTDQNFVVVDCTALPKTLVESVLFGHKKGAFTGADKTKQGLIKQADGGTLFLDEVGELPFDIQKTFLRVLQERRFRPVGGAQEVESDFKLLSATNRDLDQLVRAGRFRKDLLFRLRSLTIDLPTLRERGEDIKELIRHYTASFSDRFGTETKGFSPEFFEACETYDWPGNVRELMNTMEGALSLARNDATLYGKHLPPHIRIRAARASISKKENKENLFKKNDAPAHDLPKLKDYRESFEKQYLKDLRSHAKGNIKKACQISGLSRSYLYDLLKKHDLSLS